MKHSRSMTRYDCHEQRGYRPLLQRLRTILMSELVRWRVPLNRKMSTNLDQGFSNNKNIATYKVEDEKKKLTIEEMNSYVLFAIFQTH